MEDTDLSIDDQDFSSAEEHRLHRECGITCHLSSHKPFCGKIKAFPEDFKVIEINNDGNLVCPPEDVPKGWDPTKFRREKISVGSEEGDPITEAEKSDRPSDDKHQGDTFSVEGAQQEERKAKDEEKVLIEDDLHKVDGKDSAPESVSTDKHQEKKVKMGEKLSVQDDLATVKRIESVVMGSTPASHNRHAQDQSSCSQESVETTSISAGDGMEKCRDSSHEGDKTGTEEAVTLDMEGILGEERINLLKDFSNQILEAEKEGQCDTDVTSSELLLGRFDSKMERSILHKEIKSRYPHLKTTSTDCYFNVVPDKTYWSFCSLLDKRVVDDFMRFVNKRETSEVFKFPECRSKDQRTELHRAVARHYGSFLETKTFAEEGEGSFIVVRFRDKGKKRKNCEGKTPVTFYTSFTLCKTNLETLDVIQRLARCISAHPSDFSYAGVKDKRAITWQAMAARGVTSDRLRSAAAHPCLKDVKMENFLLCQQPLRLGNLAGNVFKVLLRDVRLCEGDTRNRDHLEAVVRTAMNIVKDRGFLNYFGLQRFGSADSKSFAPHVGRALLKGDMTAAVGCLLHPDPADDPVNTAKAYYARTGDIPGTLARMPAYKTRECLLLKALRRHGTDHEGCTKAFLNVPHAMRSLFVHSYCSLVWNHMVSSRIQTYGWRAVEGDLVLETHSGNRKVRTVTKADVDQSKYSIHDVVLPLPGNSIQYPSNQLGEEYTRALQGDGIERNSFRMRALKLNIPGDYRHVTAQVKALEWELLRDGDLQQDLRSAAMTRKSLGTDSPSQTSAGGVGGRDTRRGEGSTTNGSVSRETRGSSEGTDSDGSHGDSFHVRTQFVLDPSCYATMFLREVMNT
ncbi:PREDICTED: LOW QUALITY PROTEIN: pseudouridylate synthase 7 homolog-like protein [Branchiostoma belcheri]|uniref:LOW QUALITY PROTEIN: pseudouridylate synthase 7 homolog-like protein n=1 Tax=Branchiostoma belcheri TaxID=7741 RepID=A0A6P4ZWQ3_BRABE|nr:PREDICTED: LOW QUALITY PROTEIN: pseudouridylate synthase 7 homolog-like protein [Branchiostoma belcheri]